MKVDSTLNGTQLGPVTREHKTAGSGMDCTGATRKVVYDLVKTAWQAGRRGDCIKAIYAGPGAQGSTSKNHKMHVPDRIRNRGGAGAIDSELSWPASSSASSIYGWARMLNQLSP